ncbi:MAG TPA: acyltransferase [Myxococcaceae bacterium]|nr:acyltransferase [Myxococcaceae bacterium]
MGERISGGDPTEEGWPGRALRALLVPPPGTFPALDALRTAAIVLVIGNHLAVAGSELVPSGVWSFTLFRYGWTGVDLFFVLSGFLIGRQLQRELQRSGALDVPRFLLRRGLRIWPLYFAWVAFLALALGKWQGIGPDLAFLSNYRQGRVSGGWSLSTEEQFYLVVPLLLLAVQRLFGPRGQAWAPLALLGLMPVVRAIALHGQGEAGFDRIYGPIHTHCDGLLAGLFLAWVSIQRPRELSAEHPDPWRWPMLAIAVGLLLREVDRALFSFSGLALVYGGLVALGLRASPRVRKLAGWRGFHVLSRLSFGMYLNHFEVLPRLLPPVTRALVPLLGTGPLLAAAIFVIAVLSSALVAAVTFVLVEEPFLELRARWEARHRRLRPVEPVLRRVS